MGLFRTFVFPKEILPIESNVILLYANKRPLVEEQVDYLFNKQKHKENNLILFDHYLLAYLRFLSRNLKKSNVFTAKRFLSNFLEILDLKIDNNEILKIEPLIDTPYDFGIVFDQYKDSFSMFTEFDIYKFYKDIVFDEVKKTVSSIGNGEIKVLITFPTSGGMSALGYELKKHYPYSKSLLVELSSSPYFYSSKKGQYKLPGFGYGFVPLIHNLFGTDYITLIEEYDVVAFLLILRNFLDLVKDYFGDNWDAISSISPYLSLMGSAGLISAINISKQLYLSSEENIVIVQEDCGLDYSFDFLKHLFSYINLDYNHLQETDLEKVMMRNIITPEYKLTLDVTGQRHRSRLNKKKKDYWLTRGVSKELLDKMEDSSFWD